MITNQEAFDKVWNHFIVNKSPKSIGKPISYDTETLTFCMLRGKSNTKCAIGCLIPDEAYRRHYEDLYPAELLETEVAAYLPDLAFARTLRECHDQAVDFIDFHTAIEENLREVAKEWNIIIPGGTGDFT